LPAPRALTTYGIQIKMPEKAAIGVVEDIASPSQTGISTASTGDREKGIAAPTYHAAGQIPEEGSRQSNRIIVLDPEPPYPAVARRGAAPNKSHL